MWAKLESGSLIGINCSLKELMTVSVEGRFRPLLCVDQHYLCLYNGQEVLFIRLMHATVIEDVASDREMNQNYTRQPPSLIGITREIQEVYTLKEI